MTSIAHLSHALHAVLTDTANAAARATGLIRRERQLSGASFVQALVFGFLATPTASVDQLAQSAGNVGTPISAQGLDQRFTPAAAACLQAVLAAAVQQLIAAPAAPIPLLQRFPNVFVLDSTTIALPEDLASIWPGCGGRTSGTAALKLQVLWNLTTGALTHIALDAGRASDQRAAAQQVPLPPGSLRLADLGYFSLDHLAAAQAAGTHVLSRWFPNTALATPDGTALDLLDLLHAAGATPIDRPILLGARHRVPVRLLAVAVPQEVADQRRRRLRATARRKGRAVSAAALVLAGWTIVITTVPADQLTVAEALVLLRLRWQIEVLFKLWKSHGRLDESRSHKPWRILTELYAKLLGLLVLHWITVTTCWQDPQRSLPKAAQVVQGYALALGAAVARGPRAVRTYLTALIRCFATGCRMNTRRQQPTTAQHLLALS